MKLDLEKYVIFVSFITSFFAVFLSNGIIIGVPAIANEFAMNNVIQNWVPTIFFLVVAVFTVPAGQISGKFGVKKSLLAGILVFLIGSIGACLAFSTESFLVFRVIQGAGVAFLNVSAMAMVVQAVKPQNRGKALGFTVTGVYLATSLSRLRLRVPTLSTHPVQRASATQSEHPHHRPPGTVPPAPG